MGAKENWIWIEKWTLITIRKPSRLLFQSNGSKWLIDARLDWIPILIWMYMYFNILCWSTCDYTMQSIKLNQLFLSGLKEGNSAIFALSSNSIIEMFFASGGTFFILCNHCLRLHTSSVTLKCKGSLMSRYILPHFCWLIWNGMKS